ncbi:hypothetical protein ES288_D06G083600v1 [Gossypium darwinii]|uniref:Uncharacterized protein n=1 Tax=Gossypium darwinii TaxID=34276 RepID=A0A5D2C3C2_GOSDA|nr:hypothetical protein ES288_D06G083600v1 [Gossypium darwinii]
MSPSPIQSWPERRGIRRRTEPGTGTEVRGRACTEARVAQCMWGEACLYGGSRARTRARHMRRESEGTSHLRHWEPLLLGFPTSDFALAAS